MNVRLRNFVGWRLNGMLEGHEPLNPNVIQDYIVVFNSGSNERSIMRRELFMGGVCQDLFIMMLWRVNLGHHIIMGFHWVHGQHPNWWTIF